MRRVIQYDEITKIVSSNTNKLSNYYFMKDKMVDLIDKGRISVDNSDGNICIYEDCDIFYRMYYFIDKYTETITINEVDKDIVVEIPFSKIMNEHQLLQEKILKNSGYILKRKSSQLSVSAKDVFCITNFGDKKMSIKYGVKDESDKYMDILYSNFNPLFAFLPNKQELHDLIDNKCIICAYCDGKLAGILNAEPVKNTVWIRHFVISKDFRGKGIGRCLLGEGQRIHIDECRDFKCWVDINNTPSIELYKKFGYKFDGRKANEYVKRASV